MNTLDQRHQAFADLHATGCFVMPNPWDCGSARIFAAKGAKALATSSAAHAFTLGRPDMGTLTRDEALAHAADIVAATNLPVSGDFENGFGDDPDTVAETIRLAREAGLSGCGIEDTQMVSGNPAYDFDLAVERIQAAAAAAKALSAPFMLTARADGVMNGVYDFEEGLRRLKAFEKAGANCLYMPLPGGLDDVKRITAETNTAVNVLAAGPMAKEQVQTLSQAGARRISIGSMAASVTHQAILEMAEDMLVEGHFASFGKAASGDEIDRLLAQTEN
jgi:2-methylisocitrate lyase-like PEP mutase family enzyme